MPQGYLPIALSLLQVTSASTRRRWGMPCFSALHLAAATASKDSAVMCLEVLLNRGADTGLKDQVSEA
jgi:hypothetical protein